MLAIGKIIPERREFGSIVPSKAPSIAARWDGVFAAMRTPSASETIE
jgi:hypothetical protein